MRDFWTFIGGIAVGILAVTGVFAMDKEENSSSIDPDDELEVKDDIEDEETEDKALIVRAS